MKARDPDRLMHLVLDAEATAEEARELDRLLAADPAARARFEALRELFDQLARVPEKSPPPGLADVIIHKANQHFGRSYISRPGTYHSLPGSIAMSQQPSGSSSKRKIWIGVAVAAAAALLVGHYVFDLPSGGENLSGTVAPAQRYRAPQVSSADVKLGDQSISQLLQDEKIDKALRDPAFQALAANPQAFAALAANAQAFAVLAANPQAFAAIAANPQAFAALAANPQAFAALASNPQALSALAANPQALAALAANPQAFAAKAQANMTATSAASLSATSKK